jgi:hypothetical protein
MGYPTLLKMRTPTGTPGPVTAATAVTSGSTITVTWTNPELTIGDTNIVLVERQFNSGGYSLLRAFGAAETTFNDTGLAAGTYNYRLTARSYIAVPSSSVTVTNTV